MKKFLKWFFVTILVLMLSVIAVGYYFLSTFDLNKYKGEITDVVRKQIGRELIIKGDASVGISLVPTIVIEGIELSNASWAKQANMVEVEKVEVQFSILPLLKKQIVINKIALVSPNVYLEVAKDGKTNWDFSKASGVAEEKEVDVVEVEEKLEKAQSVSAETLKENPQLALLAGFAADIISIQNGHLEYNDARSGSVTVLEINDITFSAKGADEPIKMNVDVVYNSQSIIADLTLGSIKTLLEEQEYPVDAALKAFGVTLNVKGNLKNVLKDLSFMFNLELLNPSGNMNAPKVRLESDVKGDLKIVNVILKSLDVADSVITGDITADISGEVPTIKADLKSNSIDVTKFSPVPKKSSLEVISSAQALSMVPNDPFPYELLKMANADVKLDIKKLILAEGLEASNVIVSAVLKNGGLEVSPLRLNFGGGDIQGNLKVNANLKQVGISLVSKGMLIQNLHSEFKAIGKDDFGILEGGNMDLNINLTTTGNTYNQLVQNLDGRSVVIIDKSKVQTGELKVVKSPFLSQLLSTLKLNKAISKDLDLNCAVVRTDFKKGKATFPKGIAIDAVQLGLVSDGNINLINDQLDFGLQPLAGRVDAASVATALTAFVKIKGTITNPKITIDEKQAVTTAAGYILGGPLAVGGTAVLGANVAPCYTALEGTDYATRFPAPTGVTVTTQDAYKETKDAVKGTVKEIGNTAKDSLKDIKSGTKEELENLKGTAKDLFKGLGKK